MQGNYTSSTKKDFDSSKSLMFLFNRSYKKNYK